MDADVASLAADIASRTGAGIAGFLIVVATVISLMRTVVIPRTLRSLISDLVQGATVGTFIRVSKWRRTYRGRDAVMAWAGPTTLIMQLIVWLLLFLLGFGLLIYAVSGQSLGDAIRQSGSSLFTLGFASANRANQTAIDFIAAATGPIVVALMIGFLPTIYSSYVDREVLVTRITPLGGEPAWGPEILARASMTKSLDQLNVIAEDWARWSAATRTTHTTYQVLVWVRSSRPSRHFIVAILAMLDAVALKASLTNAEVDREERELLLQGTQLLSALYVYQQQRRNVRAHMPLHGLVSRREQDIDLFQTPGWTHAALSADAAAYYDIAMALPPLGLAQLRKGLAQPLKITRAEFDEAYDMLGKAGFPIARSADEAWAEFSATRMRYEFPAYALAYLLDATPAPWSGERRKATPTAWPTLATKVAKGETPNHDDQPFDR